MEQLRRAALLLSTAANAAKDSPPKHMSNVAIGSSTAKKSCTRNWDATIPVHATQDADFKKCCMGSGRYDGILRDHYF
jgi:hypothetical protein